MTLSVSCWNRSYISTLWSSSVATSRCCTSSSTACSMLRDIFLSLEVLNTGDMALRTRRQWSPVEMGNSEKIESRNKLLKVREN